MVPRFLKIIFLPFIMTWMYCVEFFKLFIPARKKSISGDVALVSGAGQGLGKEIALTLAKRGCKLVLVDLNLESAQLVAEEIVRAGGTAHALRCNIAIASDVALLKQQVDDLVGRVDILVNNAGAIYMEFFMENKLVDIERVVAVNVSGLIFMTRTFMEGMIERKKGHIVSISSLSAIYPVPWYVVYSTTKAANCAFMRALQEQLRFDKHESYIKLTSVCPSIINTELTKTHRYRFDNLEPDYVAKVTVDAMQKNKRLVMIPSFMRSQMLCWIATPKRVQWFLREEIFNERQYMPQPNVSNANPTTNDAVVSITK